MNIKIDKEILLRLTDPSKERNIYTHDFFLARDIFWQRLEYAFKFLTKYTSNDMKLLDFGGGSGVFIKALSSYYQDVSIIDLDIDDALNILKHYNLQNVKLIQSDINHYTADVKYDVIVATDVLEHFQDLNQPIKFIKNNLRKDGFLLVTLPTENFVYELGRVVVNKTKPLDHYHSSKEVIKFLKNNNFIQIDKTIVPKYIITIPLFDVVIFKMQES